MIKQEYDKKKKLYDIILRANLPILTKSLLNRVYDKDFFLEGEDLKRASAAKVAEIISSNLNFESVFDIGCGMGIYLTEFHRIGKDVLGCDFSVGGLEASSRHFTIFQADATKYIALNRKYDLLVCFEVAEHIQKKFSTQLVKNCTRNSDTVVFTAAPLGQGGVGHINEQPYSFWIELFEKEGFEHDQDLSSSLRAQMKEANVVFWIANNIMCFKRKTPKSF